MKRHRYYQVWGRTFWAIETYDPTNTFCTAYLIKRWNGRFWLNAYAYVHHTASERLW